MDCEEGQKLDVAFIETIYTLKKSDGQMTAKLEIAIVAVPL
jgi:hypothetical protein